jgi:hypothetical protein
VARSVPGVPIDAAELVEEALRISDGSRAELGRRLGITSYAEDKIGRWLRAESKPRYEDTIALLEIAGWLSRDGVRRKTQQAPRDPLAKLEATVDQMADRTAAALDSLQAEVKELSARIPPAAGRRRKAQ